MQNSIINTMTNLIAVNTQIAGITKNGVTVGGFKLIHISDTAKQPRFIKDKNGNVTTAKDDEGKTIRDTIPGFTLSFAYKNQVKNWSGSLVEVKEELLPYGCVKLEIPLPKQLNTQSKLYGLLVMLGELKPVVSAVTNEDDLIGDDSNLGDLDLDDLTEDTEENEENLDTKLSVDSVQPILLNYINSIFIAPFTMTTTNYPQLGTDFSNWELKKK